MGGEHEKDIEDDDDAPRWAADEPTAMWDESAMRQSGYKDLAQHREANPQADPAAATGSDVRGDDREQVKVSASLTGDHARLSRSTPGRRGISWALTVALAIGLGVAVYFLIRALR